MRHFGTCLLLLAAACAGGGGDAGAAGGTGGAAGAGGSGGGGAGPFPGDGPDPDGGSCTEPLDDERLAALSIAGNTMAGITQLEPGTSFELQVGSWECCYWLDPLGDGCVEWSVRPAGGATIDELGWVAIAEGTPPGSVFTVEARVDGGRKTLTHEVHVFGRATHPLVGRWVELGWLPCEGGDPIEPPLPIGELAFLADGSMQVTWTPFEVYVDWWGEYRSDVDAGTLEVTATGGNLVPPGIDGTGRFAIDGDGLLRLEDLWLGDHPENADRGSACGHLLAPF